MGVKCLTGWMDRLIAFIFKFNFVFTSYFYKYLNTHIPAFMRIVKYLLGFNLA